MTILKKLKEAIFRPRKPKGLTREQVVYLQEECGMIYMGHEYPELRDEFAIAEAEKRKCWSDGIERRL